MSQFEKKSVNNGNLAIWLNSLKLGHLQTNRVKRPWGKKTTGYSIPQGKTKSTKTTSSGVHLTFLKHLNITNFLNEQYLVFLCTFLLIFSYSSFHTLLIHPLLFFTSCSSILILLILFFSSNSVLLIIIFLHFKLYVLLQTCILIIYIKIREKSQFEKKFVNNGNLAIWLKCLKTPQGKKTPG